MRIVNIARELKQPDRPGSARRRTVHLICRSGRRLITNPTNDNPHQHLSHRSVSSSVSIIVDQRQLGHQRHCTRCTNQPSPTSTTPISNIPPSVPCCRQSQHIIMAQNRSDDIGSSPVSSYDTTVARTLNFDGGIASLGIVEEEFVGGIPVQMFLCLSSIYPCVLAPYLMSLGFKRYIMMYSSNYHY